jgi:hypothetical protein
MFTVQLFVIKWSTKIESIKTFFLSVIDLLYLFVCSFVAMLIEFKTNFARFSCSWKSHNRVQGPGYGPH